MNPPDATSKPSACETPSVQPDSTSGYTSPFAKIVPNSTIYAIVLALFFLFHLLSDWALVMPPAKSLRERRGNIPRPTICISKPKPKPIPEEPSWPAAYPQSLTCSFGFNSYSYPPVTYQQTYTLERTADIGTYHGTGTQGSAQSEVTIKLTETGDILAYQPVMKVPGYWPITTLAWNIFKNGAWSYTGAIWCTGAPYGGGGVNIHLP